MKAEIKEKSVEKYLQTVGEHIAMSREALKGVAVADDQDYQACCDTLFEVVNYRKDVASEKEKVIGAAKLIISTVSGWFSPREKEIAEHEDDLKSRIRDYNIKCEEERQRTLKSASKLAKIDPAKARALNAEAEAALPPKVKGIAFSGKLEVKVVDESKVPKEFFKLVVDEAKLKAAAEAGELVPGVLVTDNRTVRVTPSQRGVE